MSDVALRSPASTRSTRPTTAEPVHAVKALDLDVRRGRDRRAARLVGLRQDLDAAHDRRLRGRDRTARSRSAGGASSNLPPAQAQRGDGLRRLFALSAADRARQHRLRAERRAADERSEVDEAVEEMAELLEIEPILDRYPVSISGGQQQRASLARALVRKADLYLLDEPMGQLEPQSARRAARPHQELARRARHDLDLRHPRPDRGERAGRPHRGDGGRRAAAVRHARRS